MVNVKDLLTDAKTMVIEADLPEEFRVPAFVKAVEMLWAERREAAGGGTAGPAVVANGAPAPMLPVPVADGPLAKIAARLRLGPEVVDQVFHVEDDRLDIVVTGSRLDPAKSRATKQLAMLVAAGRQGAELEEWTDADQVRHFATEFRRYDSANFATTLKEMDDVMLIRQANRRIVMKLSRPGWEAASALVRRLAGED